MQLAVYFVPKKEIFSPHNPIVWMYPALAHITFL